MTEARGHGATMAKEGAHPRKRNRTPSAVTVRAVLALILLSIILAPWPTPLLVAGEGRPLPPLDPWAMDRPQDGGGNLELGWKDSPSPDIAAYRVYRARTPGGPYRLVSERPTDAFLDYLGFVDTGLRDGVTYYYVVTAVDRSGRESAFSEEVCAVPMPQKVEAAVAVRKSMVISLAEQRLYCLENERVVHVFLVSTGTSANPTPTGNFRILYHDLVHPVPKYSGTVCYYWMGFYQDYAIHAWPVYNGVQGDYSGLGRPASHGCVRLDPTLAHIPYYWAPDGTPLSIIPGPFTPPKPPVRGGHVAASVSEPSREWYFAEGYTGGGFDTYVLVLNPGEEPATTVFDFMLPDGAVHRERLVAGPHSRMTVPVDALPGLENTEVSLRITSDRPVVAERAMYFGYLECPGGHAELGRTVPALRHYLAEGYTSPHYDAFLLLMNPGDLSTAVRITYMKPDGNRLIQDLEVPAHARATILVNRVPGMESTEFSVLAEAGRPVFVERAMYFNYPR